MNAASGIWEDDLDDIPRTPTTVLDLMSVEVADLLVDGAHTPSGVIDVINSSNDEDESSHGTDQLLERAQAIDVRLASWPEILPVHWNPVRVSKDAVPRQVIDAGMYGDSCDIYPDVMICSIWNDWRVTRLKVLRLIANLRLARSLYFCEGNIQIIKQIQQLVDGICASIPFCLGSRTGPVPLYEAKLVYPGLKGGMHSKEHQKAASVGYFQNYISSLQLDVNFGCMS